jgi:hypothetical protein
LYHLFEKNASALWEKVKKDENEVKKEEKTV